MTSKRKRYDHRIRKRSGRWCRLWRDPTIDGDRLGRSSAGADDTGARSSSARTWRCGGRPCRRAAGIGIQIVINEIRRAQLDASLATGRIVAVVQPDRIRQRIVALGANCGRRIEVAGQERCRSKIQGRGANVATADDSGGRRSRCARG